MRLAHEKQLKNDGQALIRDLTAGSIPRRLLAFAGPLFLSGLLQTTYNMADMAVVGHFGGSAGLSAVTNGGEILSFLTFVAIGFSNAGQVILSQLVGANRKESVGRLVGTLFASMLGAALALTAVCVALSDAMLWLINTPPEAWDGTADYVVICCLGLVFIYGYNLAGAILRGLGDSRHPFVFVAIASLVNVALDLLFVAVFGWGVAGAALATVIGQAVSFACALVFLYRRRAWLGFDFKPSSFRLDRELFPALVRLGVPMALQMAAITFSKLFVTSWINAYGVVASAVSGVGTKLATIGNLSANAISTAGSTMIAQCIGARKHGRVPKVLGFSMLADGAVSAAFAIATALMPRAAFGLFTDDAAVLDMSAAYVPVLMLCYASCALRQPMMSLINGSGNARMNLAIALIDGIAARVGLGLILGLACGFGLYGFWYGDALASFAPFFIGGAYYLSGGWKTRRSLAGE